MFLIVRALAGVLADVLSWGLKPSLARPTSLRAFAALVPAVLFALYFLAARLTTEGILWTTHLWAGSIVIAGAIGLLLSLLVAPPMPSTT